MTVVVVAVAGVGTGAGVVLGGAVVGFEEGYGYFQEPEELAGLALTASLLFSAGMGTDNMEAFEGERASQVPHLSGTGFSVVSVSVFSYSMWRRMCDFTSVLVVIISTLLCTICDSVLCTVLCTSRIQRVALRQA